MYNEISDVEDIYEWNFVWDLNTKILNYVEISNKIS